MNLPDVPPKAIAWTAIGVMLVACAAYLAFLYSTWHQYQGERATRDAKINEVLDRIPTPPKPVADDG